MTVTKWKKEYGVGVKKIDDQHKELIKNLISFRKKIKKGISRKDTGECIAELVEFARYHFSTEEEYFEQCNFGGAKEHIEKHIELIEKAVAFYDKFKAGEDIGLELVDFFLEWVEEHLIKMDQKYAECFKKCGLK